MKFILVFLFSIYALLSHEQETKKDSIQPKTIFSGYLEMYVGFSLFDSKSEILPNHIYSFHKNKSLNLNLGFMKMSHENNKFRTNFALMTGTYAQANLAHEPLLNQFIYEANIGVKLHRNKNFWLDIGVFPSHIGFESAEGANCYTLTRSILSDNSPYYESGLHLNYTSTSKKWHVGFLALTGWQRINPLIGSTLPAFGHQIQFKANPKIVFNSSSFVGSDYPDSIRKMRIFHDFYTKVNFNKSIDFIVGFDVGVEQKLKHSNQFSLWFSPIFMTRYTLSDRHAFAFRGEYYSDKNQVIIQTNSPNGFKTFGFSINYDYKIAKNLLWRIEYKTLSSKDAIYLKNGISSNNLFLATTSISVKL